MVDISKITDYLYVSSKMDSEHLEDIRQLGVELIISMIGQFAPPDVFGKTPFQSIWIKTYDSFLTPIAAPKLISGVESALTVIKKGGKVLVYCFEGRRRSITMASAILIAMGYTAEEAMHLLKSNRQVADPGLWYVKKQIKDFERHWNVLKAAQKKRDSQNNKNLNNKLDH